VANLIELLRERLLLLVGSELRFCERPPTTRNCGRELLPVGRWRLLPVRRPLLLPVGRWRLLPVGRP
jgi:hypothetical protein